MAVEHTIDLSAKQRETVLALLQRHLPGTAAWVYGSRAKWTSRPHSDLDLVVFATPGQQRAVSDLREAFEESNVPFRVDLFVWDEVPDSFRKQMEREHVVLVERERAEVERSNWREVKLGEVTEVNDATYSPKDGTGLPDPLLNTSNNVLRSPKSSIGLTVIVNVSETLSAPAVAV